MKTYDQNQIEKPLKRCLKCQREWYMHDDLCMECEDKYALRRAKARRCDVRGVEMTDP